jgi:hypothetical protein
MENQQKLIYENLEHNLAYGMNHLWHTPIYLGKIENNELLTEVCQEILSCYNFEAPPSDISNSDILETDSAILKRFKNEVVMPAFSNYLKNEFNLNLDNHKCWTRSWLAGPKSGYQINVHNHSGSPFVAVFYLLCDDHSGGSLTMMDPRGNANRGYETPIKETFANKIYSPVSGEFVIMPGYVYHTTDTFLGHMRLAMPVDLFIK